MLLNLIMGMGGVMNYMDLGDNCDAGQFFPNIFLEAALLILMKIMLRKLLRTWKWNLKG